MPRKSSKSSSKGKSEEIQPRPFWSGTITFGLVSLPVNLFPATRGSSKQGLRMLGPNGEPLARRYYSQKTGKNLDPDEMVRGYPIDKDDYVVVSDEELERLAPEKSRDIDLRLFVDKDSIPPLHFERAYFLTPAEGAEKAYRLLAETMEKDKLAGVATFVMRGKEYLVAIIAENGILQAETLRFADELRTPDDVGLPAQKPVSKAVVTRFEKLIEKKSKARLARAEFKDDRNERLLKLVKSKRSRGKDVVELESTAPEDGKVVYLMEVLKQSLRGQGKQNKAAR